MMSESMRYQRKLIGVEKKLGFLYVPAEVRAMLPNENAEVKVLLAGENKPKIKSYNSDHNRIFGLTPFYRKYDLSAGDMISVEVSQELINITLKEKTKIEDSEEKEDDNFIDVSGLSSQSKGNIGEDRIKEIILLYSQGLLNVYKPVIDDRGIDLIVLKEKIYNPVYIQVKTRFNVHKRNRLILTINGNTFKPHHSYYVIGLSFNQEKMEMDENILFIPSKEIPELASQLSDGSWRVTVSLTNGKTTGKYKKYFVSKEELVNRLLERIDLVNEIVN
ncbi:hypothetical protein J0871_04250 [Salegentibacter sp. BDJ18]|uniref:hypothetical protein n=1 Tax=Salegentibacter sp. BDJ18 TaxID=2816376 RepID=UPI001AAF4115|nr:hypothetical protein [Salegentibacter sp. BDJ18]MBO2543619.1 hypothetical protein [Salegentibacter sp. BDJ18]